MQRFAYLGMFLLVASLAALGASSLLPYALDSRAVATSPKVLTGGEYWFHTATHWENISFDSSHFAGWFPLIAVVSAATAFFLIPTSILSAAALRASRPACWIAIALSAFCFLGYSVLVFLSHFLNSPNTAEIRSGLVVMSIAQVLNLSGLIALGIRSSASPKF